MCCVLKTGVKLESFQDSEVSPEKQNRQRERERSREEKREIVKTCLSGRGAGRVETLRLGLTAGNSDDSGCCSLESRFWWMGWKLTQCFYVTILRIPPSGELSLGTLCLDALKVSRHH